MGTTPATPQAGRSANSERLRTRLTSRTAGAYARASDAVAVVRRLGLIVVEAMLHGIPVVSSGPEARRSQDGYAVLDSTPSIERYEPVFDERGMPRPVLAAARCRAVGHGPDGPSVGPIPVRGRIRRFRDRATGCRGLDPLALEHLLADRPQHRARMRILLVQNSTTIPRTRWRQVERLLVEALAARWARMPRVRPNQRICAEQERRYIDELTRRAVSPLTAQAASSVTECAASTWRS